MVAVIALIPARAGSKRLPHKNIKLLAGHPLIAYSVSAARDSGVFERVILATDSEEYADVGMKYGAEVPFLRPAATAGDRSPDIEWVTFVLEQLFKGGQRYDCFSILRPTSPFRKAETIRRAWAQFSADGNADSLRAVEKCSQHPGKMWRIDGNRMTPLLDQPRGEQPWHSRQYPTLPEVYVQNASLEIAWTRVVFEKGTIAGDIIMPFLTEEYEGFDVNTSYDWGLAEKLVADCRAELPIVHRI